MNPLIQLKQIILPLLVGVVLACFGLLSQTQAVVPPPDGCYPNFTTAEGCDALTLSPPALEIQGLVGVRSFPIPTAVLTLVLAAERWSSTTGVPIRQWALWRCYSTRPAQRIRPLELTRSSLTTPAAAIRLSARSRCLATLKATTTRPAASSPSISTPPARAIRPPVIMHSPATPPAA